MEFLVHIGINKTGTSSLQRAFFDHRAALAELGIVYPEMGIDVASHHDVSRALKGVDPASLGMPRDWKERLLAECDGAKTCLLSSENFHTIADPSKVLALCPAGQTRIVVYIREHAAHLVSWYQQAIQSRNTAMTLDEFIEHHALSFLKMIQKWEAAFGPGNVTVRLYDRAALKDGDVISDFCAFLGDGAADVLVGKSQPSNPSVGGNLLFIKRVLNCFVTKAESLSVANEVAGLTNIDPTFAGKVPVSEETLTRIQFLCRKDRAGLNERYGLNMKPRLKPIEGPAFPDWDRLAADFEKIQAESQRKGFKLCRYLDRMTGMFDQMPVAAQNAPGGHG